MTTRRRDLEEVLDTFWVVAAALTADTFHFLHLSRLARRLDVLEVHFRVLAEVDDGAEEVEQACMSRINTSNINKPCDATMHKIN